MWHRGEGHGDPLHWDAQRCNEPGSQLLLPTMGFKQTAFLASCFGAALVRVPGASAAPFSPAKAQGGEKGETHVPSCRRVKRNRAKKKRRGEGAWDGHTHALVTGPFKCFPTMKASALPPTTAQTVKREVLLEVRRVRSHEPQPQTGSAKGLLSKGPFLHTHPHSRVTSRPALESGFFRPTLSRFFK